MILIRLRWALGVAGKSMVKNCLSLIKATPYPNNLILKRDFTNMLGYMRKRECNTFSEIIQSNDAICKLKLIRLVILIT